jgi:hypothetical protein
MLARHFGTKRAFIPLVCNVRTPDGHLRVEVGMRERLNDGFLDVRT